MRTPGLPSGSGLSNRRETLLGVHPGVNLYLAMAHLLGPVGVGEHCRTTEAPGRFPHFKGGRVEAARPLPLGVLWDQDVE